ncbi:MAG TPA: aminotransferase class IV, partial [Spirochaetia bacterium]|nr:aminotransferase class IV [Spirochaetia bacterium]
VHSSPEESARGVSAILVGDTRWSRCDIKSLALLPNVLAAEEANEKGVREALFVRDGMVIEGSRSNFAGIRSGRLITPPESNYMLPGISRGVVIELCERLGIPVEQRPVPERELHSFDELILIGTSAEVLSIVSVDGKQIGDGRVGSVSRRLKAAFAEEVERLRLAEGAGMRTHRREEIAG